MQNNDAKQFLAFDALNGYYDMISDVNKIKVEKKELTSDEEFELNFKIMQLKRKMMVSITYYEDNEYKIKEGLVSFISFELRYIRIVKTKILIDDILKINIL